eukprot:512610-Pelagomonas_calceolata.AAC.1
MGAPARGPGGWSNLWEQLRHLAISALRDFSGGLQHMKRFARALSTALLKTLVKVQIYSRNGPFKALSTALEVRFLCAVSRHHIIFLQKTRTNMLRAKQNYKEV